jgi:hypothetical protein
MYNVRLCTKFSTLEYIYCTCIPYRDIYGCTSRYSCRSRTQLSRLNSGTGTTDPQLKIGATDRTLRETLQERLDETPNNARCFAQGSSLMC